MNKNPSANAGDIGSGLEIPEKTPQSAMEHAHNMHHTGINYND